MEGILRAWNVSEDVLERASREADVKECHIGGCIAVEEVVMRDEKALPGNESLRGRLSLVVAIWVRRDARSRRSC